MLRLLVPGTGVASIVIVLSTWWYSTATVPQLTITDVSITDEGIAMDAPLLRGEDDEGRPYELRASEAYQSLSVNPVFVLRDLEGDIQIDDDEHARVDAPQARFSSETATVVFEEGQVRVRLTSGVEVLLGIAEVNLESGTLSSNQPVAVINDEVVLDAGGVQAFDGGKRLVFTDGVRMVFQPAQRGT